MYRDGIGQVHPSSTIDQYHLHRRPRCLQLRQRYVSYHQLHSELSSVSREPVRQRYHNYRPLHSELSSASRGPVRQRYRNYHPLHSELSSASREPVRQAAVLKTFLYDSSPNVMVTGSRINIGVVFKEIFLVVIIILVTTGSCNDMIIDNKHVKFEGQTTATKSTQPGSSSHNPYPMLYHSSTAMTSSDRSPPVVSPLSSKRVTTESLSLHSEQRTLANSVHKDERDTQANILNFLISNLEKLHILNKTDVACFRLDKITITHNEYPPSPFSSTLQSPASSQKAVDVHLYFLELPVSTSRMEQWKPSNQQATSSNQYSTLSHQHRVKSNQPPESSQKSDNRSHKSSGNMIVTHDSCVSDPEIEVRRLAVNSYMQEDRSQSVSQRQADNHTPRVDEYNTVPAGGLSRTQIVVISTCSGIIGMFFLIAAFLRLRNYIKRFRMEQEMARRPKFRSCSVALRGAAQSMEQLRRDSAASKGSHQNSLLTQGSHNLSGSQREISATSFRYQPDQAPLLINSKSVQALDASALADSHPSLKYIDEISMTPKKKDIPLYLLAKNNNNNNNNNMKKYIPKEVCLAHQAEISLHASNLLARQPGSLSNNAHIPKAPHKICRFGGSKIAGHLNPVPSTGSFKGRVLEGAVTPDLDQLEMMPRLRWFRVAGDRNPEAILGIFTKSGSTGQIGEHVTSNTDSRLVVDFGHNAEEAGVGLVKDRSNGTQSKQNVAMDVFKDEHSPPQVLFGDNSEEAVSGDVYNLDTELHIVEQDIQDEAAQGGLVDKVSTNIEASSSGVPAGTESSTNMACVADQNYDCFLEAENSGQREGLEFTTISLNTQTEIPEVNAIRDIQGESVVIHENAKSLTQSEDTFSHSDGGEHSLH